jgi:hypothetical protein
MAMRIKISAVKYSGSTPVAQKPIANTTSAQARINSLLALPVGGIQYSMTELIRTNPAATLRILPVMLL